MRLEQGFVVEQLGHGAFGTVWKARDTKLDRVVAVKIPRKGQLDREETEKFITVSSEEVPPLRGPDDAGMDFENEIGFPGQFP